MFHFHFHFPMYKDQLCPLVLQWTSVLNKNFSLRVHVSEMSQTGHVECLPATLLETLFFVGAPGNCTTTDPLSVSLLTPYLYTNFSNISCTSELALQHKSSPGSHGLMIPSHPSSHRMSIVRIEPLGYDAKRHMWDQTNILGYHKSKSPKHACYFCITVVTL